MIRLKLGSNDLNKLRYNNINSDIIINLHTVQIQSLFVVAKMSQLRMFFFDLAVLHYSKNNVG